MERAAGKMGDGESGGERERAAVDGDSGRGVRLQAWFSADVRSDRLESSGYIFMVIGAILVGYATYILQQGLGPSLFTKILPASSANRPEPEKMAHTPIVEQVKEEQIAGWPSFSQVIVDLSKLALEGMGSIFLYLISSNVRRAGSRKNLTLLKDSLKMHENESEAHSAKKLKAPAPRNEDESYSNQVRLKSQKERTKHRHREKSEEVEPGPLRLEVNPVEPVPDLFCNMLC
ncbi:hypothetical protein Droror1_Dr00018347 [Drosera rotundifolia]